MISHVKKAGIADRCGALHAGDQLLSLNNQSLEGYSIKDIQHMLKYSAVSMKLEIIHPHGFPMEAVDGIIMSVRLAS